MPLLPTLVGGITVRERRKRYEDEPRYRRLDFVRSRRSDDNSDEWEIVRSSEPVRALQIVDRPVHPSWGQQNPQWHQFHNHGAKPHWHPNIPVQRLPGPLSPEEQHRRPDWQRQHQIEEGPHNGSGGSFLHADDSSDDSDSESIVAIIHDHHPNKKKIKSRSKPRPRHSGHTIFEESDSDDDAYRYYGRKVNVARGRSRSRHSFGSEDRRSRSRRSVHRGW